VGSRRATPDARAWTEQLAAILGRAGVCVVSGGALGIDAAAHVGCMEGGGFTAAVVLSPVDHPHPRRHRQLFDAMAQRGALLADPDLPRQRWAFIRRNRWIAAIADHVVVVQAGPNSGSTSTAHHAQALGRPLWAVPGARGSETNRLIKAGANLLDDPADLLSALGCEVPTEPILDPLQAQLTQMGLPAETLARQLDLPLPETLRRLSELEMTGRVRRSGRVYYAVSPRS
jgi:DNA processing protein